MGGTLTRAVLVVATLLVALPSSADETGSARAHFSRGTKLYDLGRYLEAAKEYEAAYEAKDDPAILFNIAQAYRLGRDYPDAIRAYKSFLRRVPQSDQRPQIEAHLREMQEAIDRQQAPPPATTPPATTPPATTAPATTPTTTPVTTTPAASSERTPLYKKWWLWTIVGGVVVAGVVVGVTVGVLAGRDSFTPSLGKLGPSALEVRF
ncbi:MAG TPA: tetratricopeptide repeat protein [Polyangia bacterium]